MLFFGVLWFCLRGELCELQSWEVSSGAANSIIGGGGDILNIRVHRPYKGNRF